MAHRFTVIFEKEAEGGYHVFCPTLPGCHTQSETIEEGVENIREAIGLYIESLVFLRDPEVTRGHCKGFGSRCRTIRVRVSAPERQPCDLCAPKRPSRAW